MGGAPVHQRSLSPETRKHFRLTFTGSGSMKLIQIIAFSSGPRLRGPAADSANGCSARWLLRRRVGEEEEEEGLVRRGGSGLPSQRRTG